MIVLWFSLAVGAVIAMLALFSRQRKLKTKQSQTQAEEIVEIIRKHNGTLRLGDLMVDRKIPKKQTEELLQKIVSDFGGFARLTESGTVYDFPEMMPSDDKIQLDIISLAAKQKGQVTVTDASHFLKKSMSETELLLDSIVDGKRVVKTEQKGICIYKFVEISGHQESTEFNKGDRIKVDGYDAHIIEVRNKKYKIRYDGYDRIWDDWVDRSRISAN